MMNRMLRSTIALGLLAVSASGLECAFRRSFAPTRPASKHVVQGQSYTVTPHPAVKHLRDVDAPALGIPLGSGAEMCTFLECGKDKNHPPHPRNGNVYPWYKSNFGL